MTLTLRQRWNRLKWHLTPSGRRQVIILDNNPVSIACYQEKMDEKYGEGWYE